MGADRVCGSRRGDRSRHGDGVDQHPPLRRRARRRPRTQSIRARAADRRRRGHGTRRHAHGAAANRQRDRLAAEPEYARLQASQHQGCPPRHQGHPGGASEGIRRVRRARHRRATDCCTGAHHRQCRVQRDWGLDYRHADNSREGARGAQERLKRGGTIKL